MSFEWQICKLGELGRIVTGKTPKTADVSNFGGDIPFVTPSDMDGRKTINCTARYLTATGASSVKGSIIPAGAVMVSCIGSDMGKTVIAGQSCVTNQQINSIVVANNFSNEYVYYNLSMRKEELQHLASGGSTIPILNKGHFSELDIVLPPLTEQKKIAGLLGTLDNRIALLRETNTTLEVIAQALFKSWFVDFDPIRAKQEGRVPEGMDADTAALFPDSFEESELGLVPMGWKVGKFNTFLSESSKRVGTSEATVLSAIQTGELVKSSEHFNKKVHSESIVNYKAVSPFSFAYNPSRINIGSIGLNEFYFTGAVSPVYVVANAKNREESFYIWHQLRIKAVREWIKTLCSGTVRQSLSFKDFASIPLIVPPNDVLSAFLDIRDSLFLAISEKEKQATSLLEIRDTLLPRLITGQLRLPDAELLIEESAA